jgi:hypothetical protein
MAFSFFLGCQDCQQLSAVCSIQAPVLCDSPSNGYVHRRTVYRKEYTANLLRYEIDEGLLLRGVSFAGCGLLEFAVVQNELM